MGSNSAMVAYTRWRSCHLMALNRTADGFGDHESDPGAVRMSGITASVDDEVRLRSSHTLFDGGSGSPQTVSSRYRAGSTLK